MEETRMLWNYTICSNAKLLALQDIHKMLEVRLGENASGFIINRSNGVAVRDAGNMVEINTWATQNINSVPRIIIETCNPVSKILFFYKVGLNINWQEFCKPWVDECSRIINLYNEILRKVGNAAKEDLENLFNNTYRYEMLNSEGLGFGIISNSLVAHMIYAAQATSKEMKNEKRAWKVAESVREDNVQGTYKKIAQTMEKIYDEKFEPKIIELLSRFYISIENLIMRGINISREEFKDAFDDEKSNALLTDENVKINGRETIVKALQCNPCNGNIVIAAIKHNLMDSQLLEFCKKSGKVFCDEALKSTKKYLDQCYNDYKIFGWDIVNDNNKSTINGLADYYLWLKGSAYEAYESIVKETYAKEWKAALEKVNEWKLLFNDASIRKAIDRKLTYSNIVTYIVELGVTKEISNFILFCNEFKLRCAKEYIGLEEEYGEMDCSFFLKDNEFLEEKYKLVSKKIEEERIEEEKRREKLRIQAEKEEKERTIKAEEDARKKQQLRKKVLSITGCTVVFIFAVVIFYKGVYLPFINYNHAQSLIKEGKYKDAIEVLSELDGYKDSEKVIEDAVVCINEQKYEQAFAYLAAGKYDAAIREFNSLGGYRDSSNQAENALYEKGVHFVDIGEYENAIEIFKSMGGYKGSAEQVKRAQNGIKEKQYQDAMNLIKEEKYDEAIKIFESLKTYKDAEEKIEYVNQCKIYEEAVSLKRRGLYQNAIKKFEECNEVKDSKEQIKNVKLEIKKQCSEAEKNIPKALKYLGEYAYRGNLKISSEESVLFDNMKLFGVSGVIGFQGNSDWVSSIKWESKIPQKQDGFEEFIYMIKRLYGEPKGEIAKENAFYWYDKSGCSSIFCLRDKASNKIVIFWENES